MSEKVPIEFVERKNTDCIKWDMFTDHPDPLMMWVADTELAVPKPVHEAIIQRAQHRAFGFLFLILSDNIFLRLSFCQS